MTDASNEEAEAIIIGLTGAQGKAGLNSDEAIASLFAEKHKNDLRYVPDWGRWMFCGGNVWTKDDRNYAPRMARNLCCALAKKIKPTTKEARTAINSLRNLRKWNSVLGAAEISERLVTTPDDWDRRPWLLNTPIGVIDLTTGIRRDFVPEQDLMTQITSVAPVDAPCPQWTAFLDKITDNNTQMQSYLQRSVGYCLTGVTEEEMLWFFYGQGRNGKGTFFKIIGDILHSYHVTASMDTFVASNTHRHPTEIAMLRGARLVTASEVGEGQHWDERRLKTFTGGDALTAHFMKQDDFTFTPQFKLMLSGNNRPGLRSVDVAIESRLHLVEFNVVIPVAERDKKLKQKLKTEAPAILHWAIQGCLEWQRVGLNPPAEVMSASAEYVQTEDTFKTWLAEKCEQGKDKNGNPLEATSKELWTSFCEFLEANKEKPWTRKAFGQKLKTFFGEPVKKQDTRYKPPPLEWFYQGVALNF
jgi:P4 family phage/plasmid primase-like protien